MKLKRNLNKTFNFLFFQKNFHKSMHQKFRMKKILYIDIFCKISVSKGQIFYEQNKM